MRAFDGRPPVGIKIVFEGQEEYGSALDNYPPGGRSSSERTRS